MASSTRKSNRENVRAYRERMRSRGMRLVQIWVPDTRSPEFAAEARRQSKLIAESPQEADDQAFVDSVSELNWE
ncbi:MAG: antitoxin MazE family protein [Bradyrhizobium sp.]